jgi:hypothetical protein
MAFFRKTPLSRDIMKIIFVQMIYQSIGWALYEHRAQPNFYNWSIYSTDFFAVLRLLLVNKNDRTGKRNPENPTRWRIFLARVGLGEKQTNGVSE